MAAAAAAAVYIFLLNADKVPDGINKDHSMKQILHWIGFRTDATWNAIVNDAFDSYEDIRMLTIKDIDSMATSFAALTAATGRIVFGTRRTKLLKACVHWVQDFNCILAKPTIVGLSEITFKDALTQSLIKMKFELISNPKYQLLRM